MFRNIRLYEDLPQSTAVQTIPQSIVNASVSLTVNAVNDAPIITGDKAVLADGQEDVAYIIKEADLLKGYTDADGDSLSVKDLKASNGTLTKNNNNTWTFTPSNNFSGKVNLSYDVSDGNGSSVEGNQSFSLTGAVSYTHLTLPTICSV